MILDYYATFYRHYRMCQRTAHADAHRELPDGKMILAKDEFIAALGSFLSDWAAQEGRIRLLLPAKLLAIHEEAVGLARESRRGVPVARTPSGSVGRIHAISQVHGSR